MHPLKTEKRGQTRLAPFRFSGNFAGIRAVMSAKGGLSYWAVGSRSCGAAPPVFSRRLHVVACERRAFVIYLTITASVKSVGAKTELFPKWGQSGLAQFPLFTPGYVQSDPFRPNFLRCSCDAYHVRIDQHLNKF